MASSSRTTSRCKTSERLLCPCPDGILTLPTPDLPARTIKHRKTGAEPIMLLRERVFDSSRRAHLCARFLSFILLSLCQMEGKR